MLAVIYLENNFRTYDLALALKLFSPENGFERLVTARDKARLKSQSGLEISVKEKVLAMPKADVLILLGGSDDEAEFLGVNDYIYKNMLQLQAIVAIGSATTFVAKTGLFQTNALTMSKAAYKKHKKLQFEYKQEAVVVSDNLITTVLPQYSLYAFREALHLAGKQASAVLHQSGLHLPALPDSKVYKKTEKLFFKANARYDKDLSQRQSLKQAATIYLFDDIELVDILILDNLLSHLPYNVSYIANRTGEVYVGDGIKLYAASAIHNISSTQLLIIASGKGIDQCMVSSFLTHWLKGIAPSSYRVLTIGEGEKLLGVSGALIDVDIDYLESLSLGEGKFLLTKNIGEAVKAIEIFASGDFKYKRSEYFPI